MSSCYITRRETFNAAHKLCREDWSEEKNEEVFGKCSNKNWHGHNFTIYVTVKGIPNPETGFIIHLSDLSEILNEKVIEAIDHKNLNVDVDFMKGIMPTIENLIIEIWKQIEDSIVDKGGELVKIKLIETNNNFVEYYGGKEPY